MKEIVFLCHGDSTQASTWSNVPFLFSKELENKGLIVHRANIEPNKRLRQLYDHFVFPLSKIFWPGNNWSFVRTPLGRYLSERKVKCAINRHPKAELCIFLCYDTYNKYSSVPSLLFSDWTYKILVERQGREPYSFEQRTYRQQENIITHADYVVSLFRDCARQMKIDYPAANIHNFDTNVINLMFDGEITEDSVLAQKKQRKNILFVGNKWYKDALIMLIKALDITREKVKGITLSVIGMTAEQTGITAPYIRYHGYLHKDFEAERNIYYNELMSANMVVNVAPTWGGYSSIIEAMYFYTPVIVAPYKEFVAEFGETISFGIYNMNFSPECLAENIERLLESDNYETMCEAAHKRVENYTWSVFVDNVLKLVEK